MTVKITRKVQGTTKSKEEKKLKALILWTDLQQDFKQKN